MRDLLTLGQMLSVQARLNPGKTGARDLERAMTFAQWNQRACQLANAFTGLGLAKGDRIAVLAWNCVEWTEIYAAAAKAGVIVVPINFRLVAMEVAYVISDSGAVAIIAQDGLHGVIEEIRDQVEIPAQRFLHFGAPCPA